MQLNRQNRIREADTDDTRLGDYSDIVQGSAGFVPPAIKAQQAGSELHTSPEFGAAPVVQLPVGYVVHSTQSTNGLGPGEKQALAGGFFVMFSLAIAVAIGWWITPATPPSFTANDAPAQASAGRDEAGRAIYGHAAINPATTNGDREATGEI